MKWLRCFAWLLSWSIFSMPTSFSAVQADEPGRLRVGLACVCITPEEPVWLHGYASKPRFRPFEGKLNELYAKAMVLEDAQGRRAMLVCLDLCVLRPREAEQFLSPMVQATGLDRGQIVLALSHTHSGPILGSSDVNRFPMSPEEHQKTLRYTKRLGKLLVDVAREAIEDLQPASLSHGRGQVDFVRNRRLYRADGTYSGMGPNAKRYVDKTVPVLRIDDAQGNLRGVLFGCACHPVTLGSSNLKLSGDWASFAQEYVEAEKSGVQAMFMMGCGADANSHPRCGPNQEENARKQGHALGREVCRVLEGDLDAVRGPLGTAWTTVKLPLRDPPPKEELQQLRGGEGFNARRMLAAQQAGESLPEYTEAPLAVWQFADDLTLVALANEVVSAYVPLLQEAIGPNRLWVAAYTNLVDGYVPDATIVAEGGYENRGPVSEIGYYAAEVEDVMVETAARLADEARSVAGGSPRPAGN